MDEVFNQELLLQHTNQTRTTMCQSALVIHFAAETMDAIYCYSRKVDPYILLNSLWVCLAEIVFTSIYVYWNENCLFHIPIHPKT